MYDVSMATWMHVAVRVLFLWLHGGTLLCVYCVSMVTWRQVAVCI